MLKGCDDPYFSLDSAKAFIKLKKDYIAGLGDTANFTIVGGHRDAKYEQEFGIGKLWWTSYYIMNVNGLQHVSLLVLILFSSFSTLRRSPPPSNCPIPILLELVDLPYSSV